MKPAKHLRQALRERLDAMAAELRADTRPPIYAVFRNEDGERTFTFINQPNAASPSTETVTMARTGMKGAIDVGPRAQVDVPEDAVLMGAAQVLEVVERNADAIVEATASTVETLAQRFEPDDADARARIMCAPRVVQAVRIVVGADTHEDRVLEAWQWIHPHKTPWPGEDTADKPTKTDVAEWAQRGVDAMHSTAAVYELGRRGGDNDDDPTLGAETLGTFVTRRTRESDFYVSITVLDEATHQRITVSSTLAASCYVAARAPHLSAVEVLAKQSDDELAGYRDAVPTLRAELSKRLPDLEAQLGLPMTARQLDEKWPQLDEKLAIELERLGDNGKASAAALRGKAAERTASWWLDKRALAKALARPLWLDVVRPRMVEQATRPDSAGLPQYALTSLVAVAQGRAQPELDGRRATILDTHGRRVGQYEVDAPQVDGNTFEELVPLHMLGRMPTVLLVRWALHAGWNALRRGEPEPSTIVVPGGFTVLAEMLGLTSVKQATELRAAAEFLRQLHIDGPTGEGGLFSYWQDKAAPGRPAALHLHLIGPFSPGYIARELAGNRPRQHKRLVPVPLPELLPPLVGRKNEHGAQANMQLLVLRELRVRCEELAEQGTVEIPERQWRALCDEAGVPATLLSRVLDAYPVGDGERPAFMLRNGWRFTLAPSYKRELDTILAAAALSRRGRERQAKARKSRDGRAKRAGGR